MCLLLILTKKKLIFSFASNLIQLFQVVLFIFQRQYEVEIILRSSTRKKKLKFFCWKMKIHEKYEKF